MEPVGLIGLGIMGRPMAENLLSHGFPLFVHDADPAAVDVLVSRGAAAACPGEIGEHCGIVVLMLRNGDVSREVLFGEGGAAASLRAGSLVVDMGSITPQQAKAAAEELKARGCGYLDAPVSGGEPGAVAGTLSIMAGGSERDFARAKPLFEAVGSSAVRIGGVGCGSTAKLVNQVVVNLTIAAVSEGFVLAAGAGVDPGTVYQAIRGGLAASRVLDDKLPKILRRDFTPGGKLSINHKDIKNALDTARSLGVPMPFTSQLMEVMQALKAHGRMGDDHCGIVRYFEELANVQVGAEEHREDC